MEYCTALNVLRIMNRTTFATKPPDDVHGTELGIAIITYLVTYD